MAKGINKVILIGNLGQDPDVRYTATGSAVANISVATSDSWKDKQTGDKQERTEWHKVVFFDRLAEIVGQYLRKGSKVYIEGRLQTEKWSDKDGIERYTTKIIAHEMQMLDSKGGTSEVESYTPAASTASYTPPASQPPASRPAAAPQRAAPAASSSAPPPRDFDDDIPF